MRLEWRTLRNGEEDYERIFGIYFFSCILILIAIAAIVPQRYIPLCLFARLTNLPCPTCGSYRALLLLKSGQWGAAIRSQPLIVMAGFSSLVYALYSWIVVIARKPRLRIQGKVGRRVLFIAIALVLANWIYLLLLGSRPS